MLFTISEHARQRIEERGLAAEHLAAALAGRAYTQVDGHIAYCDKRSRYLVVVCPDDAVVVTAYRLKRKQLKRLYSR
ncbi:MAG: hypothetical protein QM346_11745 [Chloroflexota bacterium]|nr:hypothetical protein [Chloroflexota bacterium]